jgi:hypothetical protein
MKNIFNNLRILNYYFDYFLNISNDLWFYLDDNLENETYDTLKWELEWVLTTNAKLKIYLKNK